MRRVSTATISICALATACGGGAASDVGAAGVGLVEEGSPQARAILELVNRASFEQLDDEIGLERRAATNIAAHVRGSDGRLGTRDDDPIGTIAELDSIGYVGKAAIARLLEFVDVAGPAAQTIEGVAFTAAQAAAVLGFANLANERQLDVDVGLDRRAAQAIIAARPIGDLEALAAVSYVGASALTKLRDGVSVRDEGDRPAVDIEGVVLTGAELQAVMDVANRASRYQLDDEARLEGRAALNIFSRRPFADVAALAAVPYVGAGALERLRVYSATWTPPFAPPNGDCEASVSRRRLLAADRFTRLLGAAGGDYPFARVIALRSSGCNGVAADADARRALADALWMEVFGATGRRVPRDIGPYTPGGFQFEYTVRGARHAVELAVLDGSWDPDSDRSAGPLYAQLDGLVASLSADLRRTPEVFLEVRLNREDGGCGQSATALIDTRDGAVLVVHRLPPC